MNNNKGLIIINLGSPDSTSVRDVRKYLDEFLMDGKVIDVPFLLRNIIVRGFIIPFRAPKSAKAYETIWTKDGSPLVKLTYDFAALVEQKINMPVSVAMRYGNPNPAAALKELEQKAEKLDEILIAPMYPHYAMSSYETALEHMANHIKAKRKDIKIRVLKPFFNETAYIDSLVASMKPEMEKENFDGFLFSYHGLPVRHLKKSDTTNSHCYASGECCEIKSIAWQTCYKHQVKETTKLVAEKLNLPKEKVHITFQSRLAGDKWVQPYTDVALAELPKSGVKKLMVLCPAFVTDCLETLEEMDDRGKEIFMHNGGEKYVRIPCLNTNAEWVETFSNYCIENEGRYKELWS